MDSPVCQSCGMPLYSPEMYGTDRGGVKIEDYCQYCYKDGQFTSDVTMEEMIKLCAKFVKNNQRELAIKNMRAQFPKLKRWARKEETQNEYFKSINKVLDYINHHLNEKPDLDTLSQIANISSYHFHRIFKATIGENLGEYVKRLRLEYVADKIRSTDLTLEELADKVGYNSKQSLSKAFKIYFAVPPSIFKMYPNMLENCTRQQVRPRICKIKSKNIIYTRIIDQYATSASYNIIWKELYMFAILNGIYTDSSESLGIHLDDPVSKDIGTYRLYPSLSVDKTIEVTDRFGFKLIEGGLYAIFVHKGPYQELRDIYKNIWFYWLPSSKYKFRKGIFFEKYLNNPTLVKEDDILTEIYIPVTPEK